MSQKVLLERFLSKNDLRFLTLKGEKYQKIGKVSDLCRKVSDTFYLVREANKKSNGFHYHAILAMKKEPPKSWFKKGVHMNLQRVGKSESKKGLVLPMPQMKALDQIEYVEQKPEEGLPFVDDLVLQTELVKTRKAFRRRLNLVRIIQYMKKEQEFPAQYADYIYFVSGKHTPLKH